MDAMTQHDRRFDPKHRAGLTGEERRARWNPPRLLALAGLRAGQTALDLGCGPGFWTLPIADIVGAAATVHALDVSEEMLAALIEQDPPLNVRPVQAELPSIPLPDASVDFIWAAFVFHEVEPPVALAIEMRRALRPSGRIGLLDWRPDAVHDDGPPRHHRLEPKVVQDALQKSGFRLLPSDWKDEDAYLLLAEME